MLKCKKYHVKIENGACKIKECEYRKTCMGENESVVAPIETAISVENKETIISNENKESKSVPELNLVEPESKFENVVSEIIEDLHVKSEPIEPLNTKEIEKPLRVKRFHVTEIHDGINISLKVHVGADIDLFFSRNMVIALLKELNKYLSGEEMVVFKCTECGNENKFVCNMCCNLSGDNTKENKFIAKEQESLINPSFNETPISDENGEINNKSKRLTKFDILPIKDKDNVLSVILKFNDNSQFEFSITKSFAITIGASLLNKARK